MEQISTKTHKKQGDTMKLTDHFLGGREGDLCLYNDMIYLVQGF